MQARIQKALEQHATERATLFVEFTSGIMSALKMIGGTTATYFLFKNLINQILTDKKTVLLLSQKIADRLDYLQRKNADRMLDPRIPRAVKGYGIAEVPVYLDKDSIKALTTYPGGAGRIKKGG